jgi:hypothetical protein
MASDREISVTLSAALWDHLRRQAAALGVAVELLVAGLVCDTIEGLDAVAVRARRDARIGPAAGR